MHHVQTTRVSPSLGGLPGAACVLGHQSPYDKSREETYCWHLVLCPTTARAQMSPAPVNMPGAQACEVRWY